MPVWSIECVRGGVHKTEFVPARTAGVAVKAVRGWRILFVLKTGVRLGRV